MRFLLLTAAAVVDTVVVVAADTTATATTDRWGDTRKLAIKTLYFCVGESLMVVSGSRFQA